MSWILAVPVRPYTSKKKTTTTDIVESPRPACSITDRPCSICMVGFATLHARIEQRRSSLQHSCGRLSSSKEYVAAIAFGCFRLAMSSCNTDNVATLLHTPTTNFLIKKILQKYNIKKISGGADLATPCLNLWRLAFGASAAGASWCCVLACSNAGQSL